MPLTNYWRNKKIDHEFRAQADPVPASWWLALLSAASATGGTLVTDGGVAAVELTSSLANWSGTQAEGSTTASSGTSGLTSNNGEIEFAASASDEVSAAFVGLYDDDPDDGGVLCRYYAIRDSGGTPITRVWQTGDQVAIAAGDLEITQS
jgi:hypothetical protein